MKKNFTRVVIIALIISVMLVLAVGCSPESKLDRMLKKLNGKNPNYEMVTTISAPLVGTTELYTKVDGNKKLVQSSLSSDYTYTEIADGKLYTYERDGDVWIKKSKPLENEEDTFSEFDASDFDYFDGVFIMKKDKAQKYGFEKLDIVVDNNLKGMTMNITQNVQGVIMTAKVVVSNCGKVKLKLPR